MASTESHIKSVRKSEKKYRDRTGYEALKRSAFNFGEAYSKEGSKAQYYVKSDYGEKHYKEDLEKLREKVDRTLKELEK